MNPPTAFDARIIAVYGRDLLVRDASGGAARASQGAEDGPRVRR